jgi:hypothetical protein
MYGPTLAHVFFRCLKFDYRPMAQNNLVPYYELNNYFSRKRRKVTAGSNMQSLNGQALRLCGAAKQPTAAVPQILQSAPVG